MKKETYFRFRLSIKEKRELDKEAKRLEMNKSEFIRHLFREFKIREDLKHAN